MPDHNSCFLFIGHLDADRIRHPTAVHLNIDQTMDVTNSLKVTSELGERCGNKTYAKKLVNYRRIRAGKNFDIECNTDSNDETVQRYAMPYFPVHRPLVAVMVPPYTPYGRRARQNFVTDFDGWYSSWRAASPRGQFCGHVALLHLVEGRHFLREQPVPTFLNEEPPWPRR